MTNLSRRQFSTVIPLGGLGALAAAPSKELTFSNSFRSEI
jgi:hypothetical protein